MTFPWPADRVARYTALRTPPLSIDGRLDEPSWLAAPRSPRFADLVSGGPTVHDTRAAVLWDDDYLYVGFWVEEPVVAATITERDGLVYTENDVEVFVAGADAYYEVQLNALGTVYEAFFVWADAYDRSYAHDPGLARDVEGARPWEGVGFDHPRGARLGFFRWDLAGLRTGVHVDGVVNDASVRDQGWTAELSVPWSSLEVLAKADGRACPPRDGDVWRIDFSRFNAYRGHPVEADSGGWAWSPHGVWDSHIPELFVQVTFSDQSVTLS